MSHSMAAEWARRNRLQNLGYARIEIGRARRHLRTARHAGHHGSEAWQAEEREHLVGALAYTAMHRAAAHGRPITKRDAFVHARKWADELIRAKKTTRSRGSR